MIGSLNVLDIVCYIQEAYRSAQHFVLGIRSWKYVVTDELFIHSNYCEQAHLTYRSFTTFSHWYTTLRVRDSLTSELT